MKYIDADKLIKAIEEKGLECSFALKMERLDTLALIASLQQEQPEVDLEKETKRWWKEHLHLNPENKLWMDAHQSAVFARHFYELGLSAKEENK